MSSRVAVGRPVAAKWAIAAGCALAAGALTAATALVSCASGGWAGTNGGGPGPSSSATSIGNTPSDPSTPVTSPTAQGEAPPSAQGPASSYRGPADAGSGTAAALPNAKMSARDDAEADAMQVQLAQPLSDDDGAELFGTACASCHSSELIAGSRISPQGWITEITKMRKWGALVDAEQIAPFAAWLAQKYPASEAAPAPARMTPAAALATMKPGPGGAHGDAAKGKELFGQACALCHGAGALGMGGGPELANDPVLRQPQAFAQLLRAGRGRMPGYDELKPADVDNLRAWLRTVR